MSLVTKYYWHGFEPYVERWSGGAHPGSKVHAEVSGYSKPLGLIPPETLTDWITLGLVGYLGYKFFFDPHAGERRRRKVRAGYRLGRMKLRRLTNPKRRRRRRSR